MIHLGIINKPTLQNKLSSHFDTEYFHLSTVESEQELTELDGLILLVKDKNALTETINWLVKGVKHASLFVWVCSAVSLKEERNILLEMGANAVVEEDSEYRTLPFIINNLYQRVGYQPIYCQDKNMTLLNEENRSVQVNGREQGLTRYEFQLLSLLYENKNTCVTYETLMNTILPGYSLKDIYRISNLAHRVRLKVKDSTDFKIEAVRSKGYRLFEYIR